MDSPGSRWFSLRPMMVPATAHRSSRLLSTPTGWTTNRRDASLGSPLPGASSSHLRGHKGDMGPQVKKGWGRGSLSLYAVPQCLWENPSSPRASLTLSVSHPAQRLREQHARTSGLQLPAAAFPPGAHGGKAPCVCPLHCRGGTGSVRPMGLEWGLLHLRNSSLVSRSAQSSPATPHGLSLSSSVRRSCMCARLQGHALILVEDVPTYCVGLLQEPLTQPRGSPPGPADSSCATFTAGPRGGSISAGSLTGPDGAAELLAHHLGWVSHAPS
ncbi:hypothetical protein NDU88_004273 [Pleurodeles waltl]|uniref:Uncharacterized protein n=1 Tax=Pleurodeles waltl TaxID=8319 RepID=A0AAV7NKL6_PLEWA|nr:hypothetical protein NDU88_004273 [Pleurodeles waltl]